MIQPHRTRADFLAEIQASDSGSDPPRDITDPCVAKADVHACVRGYAKDDLFPLLDIALSERFSFVPRQRLLRDLLIPLRQCLGNAYKHGNGRDVAKPVVVDIVLTGKGAVIAITDQGPGFDVPQTFQRFRNREVYFTNLGSGFRCLDDANITASFADGGRTVLLCYRPAEKIYQGGDGHGAQNATVSSCSNHLDSKWMRGSLSAELSEFRNGAARLESCRVYTRQRQNDCRLFYVLRVVEQDGQATRRILMGRFHASAAAAKTDFSVAVQLNEFRSSMRLQPPRPVARLAAEPRLVLYEFVPSMTLVEYVEYRGRLKSVQHTCQRVGQTLAFLHRSLTAMPVESIATELQQRFARAAGTLSKLDGRSDLATNFGARVQRLAARPATLIHGSLDWDCICYAADGGFYLFRFEKVHRSEAGLDLGGFAADLLCFTLARYDREAYRICRDALLQSYNAEATHPMNENDLHVYSASSLCDRLDTTQTVGQFRRDLLLKALNVVLQGLFSITLLLVRIDEGTFLSSLDIFLGP